MNPDDTRQTTRPYRLADCQVSEIPIAQLVGEVYDSAPQSMRNQMLSQLVGRVYEITPPAERRRLLEQLLRPLGVLSLVAIANGIFATIWFRGGWRQVQVRIEDAHNVQASDVIALANHVQQVSAQAFNGLAQVLAASPVIAGSATAALLIKILMQRARTRRAGDRAGGTSSAAPN